MGMTMACGKALMWDSDKGEIGLDSEVTYKDQNGNECLIDMREFVRLAKKCKKKEDKEFFKPAIEWIESGELTIGVFVIDGLNRLANAFPEEVMKCIREKK